MLNRRHCSESGSGQGDVEFGVRVPEAIRGSGIKHEGSDSLYSIGQTVAMDASATAIWRER